MCKFSSVTEHMAYLSFHILLLFAIYSSCNARCQGTCGENSRNRRAPATQVPSSKLQAILERLAKRQDANALDYIMETNKGYGLNLYEGDIKNFNPRLRSALKNKDDLWTTRIVPYTIDPSVEYEVQRAIQSAIEEFHLKSCVLWIPRTNEHDYVYFTQKDGCFSSIGRAGGAQEISLESACGRKGSAMHEMMHALGFFHEQSRPDRDPWVAILHQNIQPGKETEFNRLSENLIDTLGVQYDYESIMHYSRTAFTSNGQPTILPKQNPSANLGQRDGFSAKDLQKLNKLYFCDVQFPAEENHQSTISPQGWTSWGNWSDCDLHCLRHRYRLCINHDSTNCPGSASDVQICPTSCQPAVSVGCWANEPSNPAIPSVEGLYPEVSDAYQLRPSAIRRCADVAASQKYSVFALMNGGQCLTGPDAFKTFGTYGPVEYCGTTGTGTANTMEVYSFSANIDGGWSPWTEWGQCSRSCGGGRKYRYRRCDRPPPVGGGLKCQGSETEVMDCNTEACHEESKCGVKYHTGSPGTTGFIQVVDYKEYMTCEYVIESGHPDVTVSLAVITMDIEPSMGCIYDSLSIYDGVSDTDGQMIGSFCGTSPLPKVQSSGPALFVRFQSDATTNGAGYTIQFTINSSTRKACIQPSVPYHGSYTGSSFVGDTVNFSCDEGFTLVGSTSVMCEDQPGMAIWTDNFPSCMRRQRRSISKKNKVLCTFEGNLCSFRHQSDGKWHWTIVNSNHSAPHHPQRPGKNKDGTTVGHFLYVESSPSWKSFDTARVTKTMTNVQQPYCLVFWYRLYGNDLSILKVNQQSDIEEVTLWSAEGEWENGWKKIRINLLLQHSLQITFEAVLGQLIGSSAAIDDVTIWPGRC